MGPWGLLITLVAFILISVAKGWLIPKSLHDQVREADIKRAEVAEATAKAVDERNDKLTETNRVLANSSAENAAVGNTVTRLVDAIQAPRFSPAGGSE
jgi:hypothetical protein